MQPWEHMLDEFARHPDPMPWYGVPARDLRMSLADQHDAVVGVLYDEKGFVDIAGLVVRIDGAQRSLWKDVLFRVTEGGLTYWKRHVRDRRHRPKGSPPIPRHSVSRRALGTGPRDVFDLQRVTWHWHKKAEQLAEFGEVEVERKR